MFAVFCDGVYVILLQPCLVGTGERFSKMVFSPHLHVAWIFRVLLGVLCMEPFRISSFGVSVTRFWTKNIPRGRLQVWHRRVSFCPRWWSIFPNVKHLCCFGGGLFYCFLFGFWCFQRLLIQSVYMRW